MLRLLAMTQPDRQEAKALAKYIDASPSPYHACKVAAERLDAAGFHALQELEAWDQAPGRYYVLRGGSIVAWVLPESATSTTGFRIVGAHTDSPNLRIKPKPDSNAVGVRRLGIEVYGGPLLNSWLDRDLGLSGRACVRSSDGGSEERLFLMDRAILRVPQLAIHLHREIRTDGLLLNPQRHMSPIWGLEDDTDRGFRQLLAEELDVAPNDILGWDAMCHDTTPSRLIGDGEPFLSAPRLDNLCSSHCALSAMIARLEQGDPDKISVVCLFDHEEIGSTSRAGADSPFLRDLLERACLARGGSHEDFQRALADSICVSADMAHATHPNYVDKHDKDHRLAMNGGPVIKLNTNMRYASEPSTEAHFQLVCERAEVPFQKWANRNDLACGSTIGPITASNLGIRTVDIGNPQLAMHSAREMCGSLDPGYLVRALTVFLD